jgi:hypothetical protein
MDFGDHQYNKSKSNEFAPIDYRIEGSSGYSVSMADLKK